VRDHDKAGILAPSIGASPTTTGRKVGGAEAGRPHRRAGACTRCCRDGRHRPALLRLPAGGPARPGAGPRRQPRRLHHGLRPSSRRRCSATSSRATPRLGGGSRLDPRAAAVGLRRDPSRSMPWRCSRRRQRRARARSGAEGVSSWPTARPAPPLGTAHTSSPAATPISPPAAGSCGDLAPALHWIGAATSRRRRGAPDRLRDLGPGTPSLDARDTDLLGHTRFVEPEDLRHDMARQHRDLPPGGRIPFAETHVMEHGLLRPPGTARYPPQH
jgi:hypothetical protein